MLAKKLMALGGYTNAEDLERDYPTMESFVEAFPQAQVLINQYRKQTGGQQDPLTQVIIAVAEQMGIDPQQLAGMLQKSPDLVNQLSQLAAQDPNKAAQALVQVLQSSSGQGQAAEQSEMAQPGEMPMNPEEAMQMAYGGASKLSMFTRRKQGGDIAFPQAAPMYDNSIYRGVVPNIPRLMAEGGENDPAAVLIEQIRRAREAADASNQGPMDTPSIPTRSYASAQGLQEVSNNQYESTVSSLRKNKSINADDGMTVAQVWTKVTGLPWSEAKKRGLTDGSYASNIALKKDILKGVKINKTEKDSDNKQVSTRYTSSGRSAMVDKINEGYENRQGQRYIEANRPNRYTAPTREAMDLYEAGLNYIERNAANAPGNRVVNTPANRYVSPTRSAMDLYEAGQNYIERNAAGVKPDMTPNRYGAPTREAMDLYEAGLNYIERNAVDSNRSIVNTPRNLPFSYFSNTDVGRFVGRQPAGRVYAYGGGIPTYQVPPSETGPQVVRQDPSTGYPVVDIPPVDISAQAIRPPMLMPKQVQQAEIGPAGFWGTLGVGALGALGVNKLYNAARLNLDDKALSDAASKKATVKPSQSTIQKGKLIQTGDTKIYSEVADDVQKLMLNHYNKQNKTNFPTLQEKGITDDIRKTFSANTETLYNLKKTNPKQYKAAYKLLAMYPDANLKEAAIAYGSLKPRGKMAERIKGKSRRMSTGQKIGAGAAGIILTGLLGEGVRRGYNYFFGEPDVDYTGTEAVESSNSETSSNDESGNLGQIIRTMEDYGLDPYALGTDTNTPTYNSDSTSITYEENKYGGVGGNNPYGYGYFPTTMADGGDVAMPGVDRVDSEVDRRKNALFNFVKNNVTRSQMPQSFRTGGAKKKKG